MYTQQELIDQLTPIFERYPIKRAALFGSYARGEQTETSDIDLLVELDAVKMELLKMFPDIILEIWDVVEDKTNMKADVLTVRSLNTSPKRFRERILSEARYIYEA